jgi:predicted NBD/HSP70 family sugar kinase
MAVNMAADQAAVRRNNLSLVMRHLQTCGPSSRAAIAGRTGIAKATVSSLVTELVRRGVVRDIGVLDTGRQGRPASLVELDGRYVVTIGAELNVDFLAVVVADLSARVVFERRVPVETASTDHGFLLGQLVRLLEEAIAAAAPARVAAATVAVSGVVDPTTGVVRFAPNLGWHDLPISEHLARKLGPSFPITVENDANMGAFAEYRLGGHAHSSSLAYVVGAQGVGGGVVVDGSLLRGRRGLGGEVGHMVLVRDGLACRCGGRGCWETLIGLGQVLHATMAEEADELLHDYSIGPEAKVAAIVQRLADGDDHVPHALAEIGAWLGVGLANLTKLVDPDVIVLGGYFRALAPWLLPAALAVLDGKGIGEGPNGARVVLSRLGFSAASLGGAIFASEQVFNNPSALPHRTVHATHIDEPMQIATGAS